MGTNYELRLTDLIDTDILQKIQDDFSEMSGMSAVTTDAGGMPVTDGSNAPDFCVKYTKASREGCTRCEICDKKGLEQAKETGKTAVYFCHTGLIAFTAPIMAVENLWAVLSAGRFLSASRIRSE